ncbi:efflux RND transporter periplasmic adaptor subunit [Frigoriflavimonas asaccharolytica]|uniref:RND family efflux transporter MFP subunit n=1 Tax=Frigoriflavimonas asaccharolytica TaxID=2735899 RepID=A0A8J8GDH4_9FLAO|nr:efflux RND transporter periplasmic adaptor subunit [Frigoriflavimonas asaccharolytica]NRS93787.1 RND family efflux transporter MFP subunit [Frigoriflavimonas asaccharolytica]
MYLNIKNVFSTLIIFGFLLSTGSCNKTTEKEQIDKTEKPADEHGEEEAVTIATLTEEQIKKVGIEFGFVEQKELTSTLKVNGLLTVPNNKKGNATSLYGGVIKTLNVQIGSYVKKGQLIATISNPEFIGLQEDYLTVVSQINYARLEVKRQQELNAGNAGALKNLQSANSQLRTLQTRRSSLQKQISLMGMSPGSVSNSNLNSLLAVRSPISGVVSQLFSTIGAYVDVSTPIAEIVDNSSIHLDLQVFEKDLPKMKVGQIIHFTLTNNPETEYDATIFSIGASFENDSKTVSVHSRVTGNKTGLIDGMNVMALVSLDDSTSPAVPDSAIINTEGKDYIFIVTNKQSEEHHDEVEGEDHKHEKEEKAPTEKQASKSINFEKVQIIKSVSALGYTAVDFIEDLPENTKIVTKGAFFINAKMSGGGGHDH